MTILTTSERTWRRALALAVLAAATVSAQGPVPSQLPQPSGPFGIGRRGYDWTDASRLDPLSPEVNRARHLMVYVWYPSEQHTTSGLYWPRVDQIDRSPGFDRSRAGSVWPAIVEGRITSHTQDRTALSPREPRYPLVIFSPGNGTSSFSYTAAIEDLVSHGCVVAAVEHPYSSPGVAYDDGNVARYADRRVLLGDRPANVPYFEGVELAMRDQRRANEVQAADLVFALNQLRDANASGISPFVGRLDLTRVAAVGHSLGGMSAIRACQLDERFKACANLDGGTPDGIFLFYPEIRPWPQPILYVDATPLPTFTDQELAARGITREQWTRNVETVVATQDRQLRSGRGGSFKVVLRAPGMNHGSFGDAVLSAAGEVARARARHNLELTMSVTRAFLERSLKGDKNTLLERPSSNGGEIVVTRYSY